MHSRHSVSVTVCGRSLWSAVGADQIFKCWAIDGYQGREPALLRFFFFIGREGERSKLTKTDDKDKRLLVYLFWIREISAEFWNPLRVTVTQLRCWSWCSLFDTNISDGTLLSLWCWTHQQGMFLRPNSKQDPISKTFSFACHMTVTHL